MSFLLIGLGNPEKDYVGTRHNVGFYCINEIASHYMFPEFRGKNAILLTNGIIFDEKIVLVKPYSYMNNSGNNIPDILRVLHPDVIIVIHDDLDIKLGEYRIKFAGGNAGHNGLKSLDSHIGKEYWRIRIGIGRPENTDMSIVDFVLGKFTPSEVSIVNEVVSKIVNGLQGIFKLTNNI